MPKNHGPVINLDHSDILKFYNSKIQGILNYYSFVDNRKSLVTLVHGLKHSCALTLALKFKFRQRAKVFKKFGSHLECKETGTKLYIPKTLARTQEFNINPQSTDEILKAKWNNKLTRFNLFKSCLICGESLSEMHHVRKIKDLIAKYSSGEIDFWTKQMAATN
jgi:Type II intron maturase